MRLLKAQNTNLRNIYGAGIRYDVNGQVIIDSSNTLIVPKGTTAERPATSIPGSLRYNTTDNRFELYEAGSWHGVRNTSPSTTAPVNVQTLAFGDQSETIFGPLDSGDPFFPVPAAAQNILVFVENVYQLPVTNYTLVQNPGGPYIIVSIDSIDGATGYPTVTTATAHGLTNDSLVAASGVELPGDSDPLENLNIGDDSSSPGSVAVTVVSTTQVTIHVDCSTGVTGNYVANSGKLYKAGSSTGAYLPGTYIQFNSAPDLDKPISVIHNLDK